MNNDRRKLTAKMVTEALDMLRKKEYEHKGNVFIMTENQYTALFARLLAIDMHLSSPWVKTSDRLPTEGDANKESMVLGWDATLGYRDVDYKFIVTYPRFIHWWMPIPPLPEVEG